MCKLELHIFENRVPKNQLCVPICTVSLYHNSLYTFLLCTLVHKCALPGKTDFIIYFLKYRFYFLGKI